MTFDSLNSPQKPLKRRAHLASRTMGSDLILGVDDPSLADSQISALPTTGAIGNSRALHTQTLESGSSTPNPVPQYEIGVTGVPLRSKTLKRRRAPPSASGNIGSINKDASDAEGDGASNFGPSLKKFKALFDSVDPDRLAMSGGISEGLLNEPSEPAMLGLNSQFAQNGDLREGSEEIGSQTAQSSSKIGTSSRQTQQRHITSSGNVTGLGSVPEESEAEMEDQIEASQVSNLLARPSTRFLSPRLHLLPTRWRWKTSEHLSAAWARVD